MEEDPSPFNLSAEQRDTEVLIRRLLGAQIADRYIDVCILAAGKCPLRISTPMAGHAIRELECIVRAALAAPMEVGLAPSTEEQAKYAAAKNQLRSMGFSQIQIDGALKALTPRLSHVEQIEGIAERLGLDPNGDIASAWKKLRHVHGEAHGRDFYKSLQVDITFRTDWQEPFDMVMRGLMIAFQSRYTALVKRVEELAASIEYAAATKSFAKEIPGALPLLWHFFHRLNSPEWLPYLARHNLLVGPSTLSDERREGEYPMSEWPAGWYLKNMAAANGSLVAEALRAVAASTHPDVLRTGFDILGALPADDAASLIDVAKGWLDIQDFFMVMGYGPHLFIKNLAGGGHAEEALAFARSLFRVFDNDGRLSTLFGTHMYEHFLPEAVRALAPVEGSETVALLCDLLDQTFRIERKVSDDPPYDNTNYISADISDEGIRHDVPGALVGEIVHAAKLSIAAHPASIAEIVATIRGHDAKIFNRIALHVLSLNPSEAPDAARAMLLDQDLMEGVWCRKEYGQLALSWFPSLAPTDQQSILKYLDAVPDKLRGIWKQRLKERGQRPPTPEEEQRFDASIMRELLWHWRAVLPKERREIVESLGDPEALRQHMFEEPAEPSQTIDFSTTPIEEVVSFLGSWHPSADDPRHTTTAFAQRVRTAAFNNPAEYSAHAAQFAALPAVFVRNLLQGLVNAATNKKRLDWAPVLALIGAITNSDAHLANSFEGDDPDWSWSRKAATELIAFGLRAGTDGIPFELEMAVLELIFSLNQLAPLDPDNSDFEQSYREFPFHAAQSTIRGGALELAILFIFWLSKNPEGQVGRSPREALHHLPMIAQLFEIQLSDQSPNGRIPRAVMGRYLQWLYHFGESWLRKNLGLLFPSDNLALRDASWLAHLTSDNGPIEPLAKDLHDCYVAEIERFGSSPREADHFEERFATYLVILYIFEAFSEDVFELFWQRASVGTRKHAIWFLGIQLELPPDRLPANRLQRAYSYWEKRLDAARTAVNPDAYREEIGAIGQFFFRKGINPDWLMSQMLAVSDSGFAPRDGFSVLDRLAELSSDHPDRAAEVLTSLVKNPRLNRSVYAVQQASVRTIIQNGFRTGAPETTSRMVETINLLAGLGDTSYMNLLPSA